MAKTQMNSPAVCPVSSLSTEPGMAAQTDGLTIKGQSLPQRTSSPNAQTEVIIHKTPEGMDMKIK